MLDTQWQVLHSEGNLENPSHAHDEVFSKEIPPCFETQGRYHLKCEIGVSVAKGKGLMSLKIGNVVTQSEFQITNIKDNK